MLAVADSLHQQIRISQQNCQFGGTEVLKLRLELMIIHIVRRDSEDLLLPGGWELLGALVVAGQPVNTALDQNQTELRVLVLAVPLQMLAHSNGFLDQVVQILGNLRAQTCTQCTQ